MRTRTHRVGHLAGGVCLAALLTVGACGDDDATVGTGSASTTTTAAAAPSSCTERFLAFMARPDVVEAARTDADELPAAAEAESQAIEEACDAELDAMSYEQFDALLAQADPEVVEYLSRSRGEHEFQKTGSAISGS